jgi:hypothetical protein
MARYSKSASGDVKRAMKRRKAGTLKSGRSGKAVKSKKQAIRDRTFGGSCERQEGFEQEVRVRAARGPINPTGIPEVSSLPPHSEVVSPPRGGV